MKHLLSFGLRSFKRAIATMPPRRKSDTPDWSLIATPHPSFLSVSRSHLPNLGAVAANSNASCCSSSGYH